MKNLLILATLVTGIIGCVFILIGESTPQWVTLGSTVSYGLFVQCIPECTAYDADGSLLTAKALVVVGFLASVVGVIVLIVYYIKHACKDTSHRTLSTVIAVFFIVAALAALIGAIIFATAGKSYIASLNLEWIIRGFSLDLGYSFALTIVGSIMAGAAGVLAVIHRLGVQN